MPSTAIEGQLNARERDLLTETVRNTSPKPRTILEVGTWLGGGSTLHFLRALQANGEGHLWGIEANRGIYERMLENIRSAAPETAHLFTPLFGFSDEVIPKWLAEQGADATVDLTFLDGGDNPMEQIMEFRLLDPVIPVGGQLFAHDAFLRKGKWLVPYMALLDHWKSEVRDISKVGLLCAQKLAPNPSPSSLSAANRHLAKMRLQPAEIAAAVLPSWFCAFVLRILPSGVSRRLSEGVG